MTGTQYTQLERAKAALKDLEVNVTAGDRADAVKKFGFTPTTLSRYFNGKGNNLDVAARLVRFFRHRISAREAILPTQN